MRPVPDRGYKGSRGPFFILSLSLMKTERRIMQPRGTTAVLSLLSGRGQERTSAVCVPSSRELAQPALAL